MSELRVNLDPSWDDFNVERPGLDLAASRNHLAALSAPARALPGVILSHPYGAGEKRIMHLLPAPAGARRPIVAFVHGGGWKGGDPHARFFPAPVFAEAGCVWATIGYPLRPEAPLEEMVASIRAALAHLRTEADRFGGDPERLHLLGHSAGAHLAAAAAAGDSGAGIASLTLISGMMDLRPLLEISPHLGVDAETAARLSPLLTLPRTLPTLVAVAENDPPGMVRQMLELYLSFPAGRARLVSAPGADHFSILAHLADPDSALFSAIRDQIFGKR